jgi:hypothetical protein
MNRVVRIGLIIISLTQLFAALACLLRLPLVRQLWPLDYTGDMSFIFIASISAAAAASTLWCVFANEPAALFGVGLDYVTIFTPVAISMFRLAGNDQGIFGFAVFCVFAALVGVALLLYSWRLPFRDTRPMPRWVRLSFGGFVLALIIGGTWVLLDPTVLPWRVNSDIGVLYGWFFIGAAAYFGYGLLRPYWHNAAGQLAGFLAYDLILIVPFIMMLPTIADRWRVNLPIYMSILIVSGLLAVYYLFIARPTRMSRLAPK